MLPLFKMASQKNNSVVSCQLGGQNITLYLIWLGTSRGTPHCPSAIASSSSFKLPAASSLVLLIVAKLYHCSGIFAFTSTSFSAVSMPRLLRKLVLMRPHALQLRLSAQDVVWAERSLLTDTARWGNNLLALVSQKLRKKSGLMGTMICSLAGLPSCHTLRDWGLRPLIQAPHVQLHELLTECCYHAAVTPASVHAYFKHEHLLLVLSSQLAIGCADDTCMCAIAWGQKVMEIPK